MVCLNFPFLELSFIIASCTHVAQTTAGQTCFTRICYDELHNCRSVKTDAKMNSVHTVGMPQVIIRAYNKFSHRT